MDGSQKLPQRLLAPIRDCLSTGVPIDHLCLAVAGWIRYTAGRDELGRPIQLADPLAARFAAIAAEAGSDPAALTQGFLGLSEVFDADLPRNARFVALLTKQLRSLISRGARATVADCIAG